MLAPPIACCFGGEAELKIAAFVRGIVGDDALWRDDGFVGIDVDGGHEWWIRRL